MPPPSENITRAPEGELYKTHPNAGIENITLRSAAGTGENSWRHDDSTETVLMVSERLFCSFLQRLQPAYVLHTLLCKNQI